MTPQGDPLPASLPERPPAVLSGLETSMGTATPSTPVPNDQEAGWVSAETTDQGMVLGGRDLQGIPN